jgi:hypothetical protein
MVTFVIQIGRGNERVRLPAATKRKMLNELFSNDYLSTCGFDPA